MIEQEGQIRTIWHNGMKGGYSSYLGFDRDRGIGVVLLANSTNAIDDIGVHLLKPWSPLVGRGVNAVMNAVEGALERVARWGEAAGRGQQKG